LKYNLVIAASAEEEISGTKRHRGIMAVFTKIDFAMVGAQPYRDMALAEGKDCCKDCLSKGTAGQARPGRKALCDL